MKTYMNDVLQVLNSISRMAVIENATVTEKMISNYNHILRYRWNEEGKEVTAAKEVNMAVRCYELFTLKNNGMITHNYKEDKILKTIFIPHYTIVVCLKNIIRILDCFSKPFGLQIKVEEDEQRIWIHILLTAETDFNAILEIIRSQGKQGVYEDFDEAVNRWKQKFGEEAFKLKIEPKNKGQLEMSFGCQ